MTLHPLDQIDVYLAGGLSDSERVEFESHIAGCATCAAALKEASDMDATVNQLFSAVRPVPGFEDRLIQRLKQIPGRRRLIHPIVKRIAIGVAAGIFVASVGYVGNAAMNGQPQIVN